VPSAVLLAKIFFLVYPEQNISERIDFVKGSRRATSVTS